MNALPDYILIEFFDWVKTNGNVGLNIGFVRECVLRDKQTHCAMEDLIPYAKKFIDQNELDIKEWELIESMRAYLTYRYKDQNTIKKIENSLWNESLNNCNINSNKDSILHMMIAVPEELHTEIEFLEWLLKQQLDADDINKMPKYVFEELAKKFLIENNGTINNNMLACLRYEFKENSPWKFLEKFKRLISLNTFKKDTEKYKKIAEIFGRYADPNIMKCLFLPLAQDNIFDDFIKNEKTWMDLNSLSSNYLDIYYSVNQLSLSGYDIKQNFHFLDIDEDALPCLILWEDFLENA